MTWWHPPYKVTIANGITLKVESEGGMVLKTWPEERTSAKKYIKIIASGSLHVPEISVTLIS